MAEKKNEAWAQKILAAKCVVCRERPAAGAVEGMYGKTTDTCARRKCRDAIRYPVE